MNEDIGGEQIRLSSTSYAYKPCYIGKGLEIGEFVSIGSMCHIGRNVQIGEKTNIQGSNTSQTEHRLAHRYLSVQIQQFSTISTSSVMFPSGNPYESDKTLSLEAAAQSCQEFISAAELSSEEVLC